ncbi:ethanolamine permease [Flammeovirga kamogawensis]|uniref:Ethanolamine permease n=1 Tax=Flammeovirga kamogawensis TaxID=373891 RepID=A0ABX8GY50_9BACT|nr:ethanolamine permease [Flammeovirga kamogawensis]MBB6458969.1 ethanolamine permease [Flammeovirga kamogawensis]QWG08544.1 ethanolamine permease [Flammeovirga kamogawensis]TRX66835.1 ethanolamine permease [Flammeovirga kamogawensis]
MSAPQLTKTLTPLMLWGLGVGYVISGMYFGWNLGLAEGGTLGLAIATFFVVIMYVTFTFSYTELACAIPKAGGAFEYAKRGLGPKLGFLGGMAQNIEFIFAPPAIASAIGAYLNLLYPSIDTLYFAIAAYFIFTAINILGVKLAATFELIITILAVLELLIFSGVTLPHFEFSNLTYNAFPNGIPGIFASIPFAIWFFLAIEGVANVAEETKNPSKSILLGFGSSIITLVVLCVLTFVSAVGVGGWEAIVYLPSSTVPSDSPLPLALGQVVSEGNILYKLLIGVGLLGLVASFHGIILAAGRSTFEFGREGYAPKFLSKIHPKFKTPIAALLVNMIIGIIALFTGKTAEIITIACFGALVLYIISMLSFFSLRKKEPNLNRPFKVPFYPFFPLIALVIATVSLVAMTYYNLYLAIIFIVIMLGTFSYFIINYRKIEHKKSPKN